MGTCTYFSESVDDVGCVANGAGDEKSTLEIVKRRLKGEKRKCCSFLKTLKGRSLRHFDVILLLLFPFQNSGIRKKYPINSSTVR